MKVSSMMLFRVLSSDLKNMIPNITPEHIQKYLTKVDSLYDFINTNHILLSADGSYSKVDNNLTLKDSLDAIVVLLKQQMGGL